MEDHRLIKPYQIVLGLIGCAIGISVGIFIDLNFIVE